MNDELRVLLDYFRFYSSKGVNNTIIITPKEMTMLLDYIKELENKLKEKDEGFMASISEMCDYAVRIDLAINILKGDVDNESDVFMYDR